MEEIHLINNCPSLHKRKYMKLFKKSIKYEPLMTIKDLKNLVKDLPEVDEHTGEPFEVYIETGIGLSSSVSIAFPLNRGDLLLASKVFLSTHTIEEEI
jgi:hypothetical protein